MISARSRLLHQDASCCNEASVRPVDMIWRVYPQARWAAPRFVTAINWRHRTIRDIGLSWTLMRCATNNCAQAT
jgi:hypothetical protein